MDRLRDYVLSEVRQKQIYNNIYIWDLKNDTNELIYKTEIDSQTQKTNLWLPKGNMWGGINQEDGINIYTLLQMKQITNNVL